jgi:hypothetical protein
MGFWHLFPQRFWSLFNKRPRFEQFAEQNFGADRAAAEPSLLEEKKSATLILEPPRTVPLNTLRMLHQARPAERGTLTKHQCRSQSLW